jgi:hypothetical protein
VGRDRNALEQAARRSSLLRHDRIRVVPASIRIADCVGAAIRNTGKERLRSERPVDSAPRREAISRDAAHFVL